MERHLSYLDLVWKAAQLRDGTPLYNGSLDHASVLADAMFAFSNSHVNVLTGELNPRVFGTPKLIGHARAMLARPDCMVRVLLEREDRVEPLDHPFVIEFSGRQDVEYRVLPSDLAALVPYHFIEMDGDSYRYEKDKNLPEAVAAFGDVAGAKRLNELFEKFWERSSEPTWAGSVANRGRVVA